MDTAFKQLQSALKERIIGQKTLIERLLVAVLADGHLLVQGPPGLAKTRSVKTLSELIAASFHRIQFTPDLLPSDLTGSDVYRIENGTFEFQRGPLFHQLILADEINRAPAKVQSALLEAMEEKQITVGKTTHSLSSFFLVMATSNPLEQEGTYPLSEAQSDRFLMQINLDYPTLEEERAILNLVLEEAGRPASKAQAILSLDDIARARKEVLSISMASNVEHYLLELVLATRQPEKYGKDLRRWVRYGASPRATLAMARCAKALAWMSGRDYVAPEDLQKLFLDVMRHRVILSYEAAADGVTTDKFLTEVLARVCAP